MKSIIHIIALICSLFANPTFAAKSLEISMINMKLIVVPPLESRLEDGNIWKLITTNPLFLGPGQVANSLPYKIPSELQPYVKFYAIEYADQFMKYFDIRFKITADPVDTIRFIIKEEQMEYPIEILPASRNSFTSIKTHLNKEGTDDREEITYYNGLGYSSQKIEVGISNNRKSLIYPFIYDRLMRNDAKSYLPYAYEVRLNLNDKQYEKNLKTFYTNSYNEPTYYFTEKIYENSPLGRVRKTYASGKEWRTKEINTQFSYLTNIAGNDTLNCIQFKTTESDRQSINIEAIGNCQSSELFVTRTENEDHLVSMEFKNKFDQVVLNRQIEHKNSSNINYDTYYVYDEFDNLKAVLPPMVSSTIQVGNKYSSQTFAPLAQYAYLYKYDARNHRIASKLPGCEWKYQIYDLADHLVFSQTGEQRKRGEWQFMLPDAIGRECITGICKNTIDPFNSPISDQCVKCTRTNKTDPYLGYSITGITLSSASIMTVKYYDDYEFSAQNNFPNHHSHFKYEVVGGFGERYATSSQGLQTGSMTAHLNKDGSLVKYNCSIMYYDSNGQIIQAKSTNHLEGYEKTFFAYDFTGQPVRIKHIHSTNNSELKEENKHIYNHAGRLSKTVQIINDRDSVHFTYKYDDLGNMQNLVREDGKSTLTTTNSFNIHNWLISTESPLFSQTLHYTDGPGTPQYSGNISSTTWKTATDATARNYQYSYDGLGRLANSIYSEGSNPSKNTNNFNEQVTGYDKQGNITGLKRYGQTGMNSYGLIDNLSITYVGNQLRKVTDNTISPAYANVFEFKDGENQDIEYVYDTNGNLTKDLNKNISDIQYNYLNLPRWIQFKDGSEISYLYGADGTKLQTTHIIARDTTTTDYCGNVIYENGIWDKLLINQGYFSLADKKFHYYLQDHQGNNRVVTTSNGTIEEVNHYYPFGGTFSSPLSVQPYKYTGKELDTKKGLNWYDYGARQYDAALGKWHAVDPMAETYYEISPYAYCDNDPVNLIDPNGKSFTKYQDQYGNLLKNTNDGINNVVTVPNERLGEFKEHLLYTSNYLFSSKGWNEYWTDEFKGTEAFKATPKQQAALDAQHSDWARKTGIEYWKNPTLWNWFKYVASEVLSQYTDPQLVVGGLSAGMGGISATANNAEIWTKGSFSSAKKNAVNHWTKHGFEFPEFNNAKQYVDGTHHFLHKSPSGTLNKARSNGDMLKYHPATNTFGAMDKNGTPRTMFKPKDGIIYWNKQ